MKCSIWVPIVEHSKRWLAERIATYEEPIGRLLTGMISTDDLWGDLVRNGPSGLSQPGDRGLNYSRSFERTYWGGAIYFLLTLRLGKKLAIWLLRLIQSI